MTAAPVAAGFVFATPAAAGTRVGAPLAAGFACCARVATDGGRATWRAARAAAPAALAARFGAGWSGALGWPGCACGGPRSAGLAGGRPALGGSAPAATALASGGTGLPVGSFTTTVFWLMMTVLWLLRKMMLTGGGATKAGMSTQNGSGANSGVGRKK